jgi:hypothetical protein
MTLGRAPRLLMALPRRACCWPIGHLDDPGFRWCGREAVLGHAYCDEHLRRSLVRLHSLHRNISTPAGGFVRES